MKKADLLKLIEGLGDDESILETLNSIEGLAKSSELDITKLTIEDYKNILENNQIIQGYWTSQKDSAVSKAVDKALKNYEEKKLPLKIEEALKSKANEGKTPEQIELEELKNTVANMQKEKTRAELSSKYTKILGEKKLPTELVDYILNDDESIIEGNIAKFETLFNTYIDNGVKIRIGDNNYTPPKRNEPPTTISKKELLSKGIVFISQFKSENPEEYNRIMNS